MKKLFRWKAIIPLTLILAGVVAVWLLLLDGLVRRGIEFAGSQVTGARVDLAEADVSIFSGRVRLRGLQVADPSSLMENLLEAREIVADLRIWPLLRRKVIVDTVAVRGLRFGTARTVSGELPKKRKTTGAVAQRVSEWEGALPRPRFTLEGIGGAVVDTRGLVADSLASVRLARGITSRADSLQVVWGREIAGLDPAPVIRDAEQLAARLKGANVLQMGIRGVTTAITESRDLLGRMKETAGTLKTIDDRLKADYQSIQKQVEDLAEARQADYAYARSLLDVPSLDAPDIGPGLFGDMVRDHLEPVLKYLALAEKYMPPGMDPRRRPGPTRTRMDGTTVEFPSREHLPHLLLQHGELEFALAEGSGERAYRAILTDFTDEPAVLGRPTRLQAVSAGTGTDYRLSAVLDHTGAVPRDSLHVASEGISIGAVGLGGLGGRMLPGAANSTLTFARTGDRIDARLSLRADGVRWERSGPRPEQAPAPGSTAWAQDFVWRTLEGLRSARIEARLQGPMDGPSLRVDSNVSQALSDGLKRQMGEEVAKAQQRVRAEVDRLITGRVGAARARADAFEREFLDQIEEQRAKLEAAREELDTRMRELARKIPGGDMLIPPGD